jgi:predicted enzyme related to lactoylglutathione lyase
MSLRSYVVTALVLAGIALPCSPVLAEGVGVERFGIYVPVEDLDRASAFYEALFGKKPQVQNASLVGFDVAGGLYAAVSRRAYALEAPPRSGVRPYIKVRDIHAAFRQVRQLAPGRLESEAIVEEGSFSFFRFSDPDGNVIEFFSLAAPR